MGWNSSSSPMDKVNELNWKASLYWSALNWDDLGIIIKIAGKSDLGRILIATGKFDV